ncbi:beta-lactamase superfamily domain-containing protein [Cladochytrium replicatum]|nr:beta-lactamase superfamily domain-containing protein [Cladochytrium replicatum]
MSTKVISVAPQFYRTSPPPHWPSNGSPKYRNPWPSSKINGLLSFFKTRLFDWEEPPLPPKVTTSKNAAVLPKVNKPDWGSSLDKNNTDIVFTWLAHAAVHLQVPLADGTSVTVLCDPVLSRRCSPSQLAGPERYTDSPTSVAEMAEDTLKHGKSAWPDVLVISHNHYDHLDYNTVKDLLFPPSTELKRPHVFCTLGNKAWFQSNFKLQDNEITECDWWDQTSYAGLTFTCVPAQHFASRTAFDRDRTLWAGWTVSSSLANIYFAGDTGYRSVPEGMPAEKEDTLTYCPAFEEIGETLGPFDLSLIPIGAYLPRPFMSTVHLNPADAVRVHRQVKSKRTYGIHWGVFRLTPEDVNEPPKLLEDEATAYGLIAGEFTTIEIGKSVVVRGTNKLTAAAV